MDKKELKNLSRKELVDVVYNLMDEENKGPKRKPLPKEVAEERKRLRKRARNTRRLITALGALIVAAAIAVLLSTFVFPVIQVSGDSMEPTLSDGDVLVLINTDNYSSGQLCCIAWQNKLLIKRVIALPRDVLDIDQYRTVSLNGEI